MTILTKAITSAAIATASLIAVAGSAGAQTTGQNSSDTPRQCVVTVDRSADAGIFDVVRQELDNGDCVCAITTGPNAQPTSTEELVTDLIRERVCRDAPAVAMQSSAGAGFNGGVVFAGAAGLAGLAGIVVALDDGNDAPVSP